MNPKTGILRNICFFCKTRRPAKAKDFLIKKFKF